MSGIVGVFNVPEAAFIAALMQKQQTHRGKHRFGIVSCDGENMYQLKRPGLPSEIFDGSQESIAKLLPGDAAISILHRDTGVGREAEAYGQPAGCIHQNEAFALVTDGNLMHGDDLRSALTREGAIFTAPTDAEAQLHLLIRAPGALTGDPVQDVVHIDQDRLTQGLHSAEGSYATLFLTRERLYAFRDPNGFIPLVSCRYKKGILIASETCAFDIFDDEVTEVRHLQRGWSTSWDRNGNSESRYPIELATPDCACIFEDLYFKRPDSCRPDGSSVQDARKRLGQAVARQFLASGAPLPDLVISVPDSSNAMALACAQALGVPCEHAFIRNHETDRSLNLAPPKHTFGPRLKHNLVPRSVTGKRVLVVDDSLVRGRTARHVVAMLRRGGVAEVHLRFGSPRVIFSCHWGKDTPNFRELLAPEATLEAICQELKADSIGFLPHPDFLTALGDPAGMAHCTSCFTGVPPIPGQDLPQRRHLPLIGLQHR